jgi:hypothetical protein
MLTNYHRDSGIGYPLKVYIADLSNSEPIMFYATTRDETYSFTLEKKSILVFERVVMNIGGHYNNIDGIFVAPKTGIYLFAWTFYRLPSLTHSHDDHRTHIHLLWKSLYCPPSVL